MKALAHFSLGVALTLAVSAGALLILGMLIFFFETMTGLDFPKAVPGAWRALVAVGGCQLIAGGIAAVILREGK